MGIFRENNGTAKTLSTGGGAITTWSTNEITLRGNVLAWHVNFTPNTQTLANLGGVRVKMFGQTILDLERDELRAFLESSNESNFVPAAAAVSAITIPMNLASLRHARDLAARDPLNWRTLVSFPVTAAAQIEIIGEGVTGFTAGTAFLTWTYTDMPPSFYRRLTKSKMNFQVSGNNQRYPVNTNGELRGLMLPTTGVARTKLVLNGIDAFNMPGRAYSGANWDAGEDPMSESLRMDNPLTLTDPIYIPVPVGQPAGTGSYLEMDTGATYAISSSTANQNGADQLVTDELVLIPR